MAGQYLAWLLLVTYIGVTCFTGGATVWTFIGLKHNETDNSSKVEVDPNTGHLWSPDSRRFTEDKNSRDKILDDLLVITSCGTSAVVALLIAFVGVGTRNIFRTTQATHGSLLLAVAHIAMMVVLLLRRKIPDSFQWIVEINAGAIAVCVLQVVIGVTYLKWQKKTWITLNFNQLFTLNSCFFMGRTILAGYLLDASRRILWFNFTSCYDSDNCPPWSFYFCAVSIITGIVLNVQCLLSVYFGSLHRFFVVLSSLILTVGYGCVSVLVSPLYMSGIYKDGMYTGDSFTFSVVLFSLHLIHLILLAVAPNGMTYSLSEVKLNNLEALRSLPYFKAFTFTQEQLQSSRSECLMMGKTCRYNKISLIASIVTLVLINATYWWYPRWPLVVLTSVNVSLLSRSLNDVLYEAVTLQMVSTTPFQDVVFIFIEGLVALVGFIGVCVRGGASPIVGGAGLLCIYIMKFWQHREIPNEVLKAIRRGINNEHVEESESLAGVLSETESHEQE